MAVAEVMAAARRRPMVSRRRSLRRLPPSWRRPGRLLPIVPVAVGALALVVLLHGSSPPRSAAPLVASGDRGTFAHAVPAPTPAPTATPAPTPSLRTVNVSSVTALLDALADNTVDVIVVADGTYRVSPASDRASNSLWIGARFASRTRPVLVRAATPGGVTFDGGGATYFGGISFEEGAHDQTWDGFRFANGQATSTGVVTFGGYVGMAAPHDITMRRITILQSCTGTATTASAPATDHAFYISQAVGGPHDLLFEHIVVEGQGFLASAFHFDHSSPDNPNGWNITVRRLTVTGTQQPIIIWDPTLRNITFDTASITDALRFAVRYEGGSAVTLANLVSTGSGVAGFYSSLGDSPPEVTFINTSLD